MPIRLKEKAFKRCTTFLLDLLSPSLRDTLLSIKRFYLFTGRTNAKERVLIQLVDGRDYQGGLTDRLKGIVSASCVAQIKGRSFKINHSSPFELSDYLEPNKVDWAIVDKADVSKNFFQARLFHFRKADGKGGLQRIEKVGSILQMHCYCKGELYQALEKKDGTYFDWGNEFKRLFKPKPDLQKRIEFCKNSIGGSYVAIVFRFQNLLGDFEEYHYEEIERSRQKQLIEKCMDAIVHLQTQLGEKGNRVLVTADSMRFIKSVCGIPGVFVFPGRIVHMDWVKGADYETYLKSFLDFYMIAGASEVFSIGTNEMYKSDFPRYAAMVYNVPFKRILVPIDKCLNDQLNSR